MVKVAKKLFTMSVVAMTILWSVGVAAFIPTAVNAVDCPELEAGDLFKVPGNSAVYLLNADMERMYFPNAEVYKTWYADYSGVVEIPTTCVDAYPAPSVAPYGVNYRPGSRLVKVQISNSVYAVTPNNTKVKIGSEEVAKALYGDKWASIVRDIADVYWPNLVNTGSEITTAALHDGMLVKSGDNVYNVEDGKLYEVDGDLGVAKGDVRTVSESLVSDLEMASETVTAASLVENPAQTMAGHSGTTPTTPVTGGNLTVSLSASTPVSANVPTSTSVNFLTLNLKAVDKDVNVTGFRFSAYGLGNAQDIDEVTVYANGKRYGNSRNVDSNRVANINFTTPLTIAKGQTVSVTVKAIANGTGHYALGLANAEGILSNGSVGGSFPIVGNTMSGVAVPVGSLTFENDGSLSAVKLGDNGATLAKFKVTAGNAEDVVLNSVVLKRDSASTASDSDFENLELYVDGNRVSGPATLDGRYVTFELSSPLTILKNGVKRFTVKGDVIGGAGKALTMLLDNKADVSATGVHYGYTAAVTNNFSGSSVSIGAGAVSIEKVNAPTTKLVADTNDVVLGTFKITANSGKNVELSTLNLSILTVNDSAVGSSTAFGEIENLEVLVKNTNMVYDLSYSSGTATKIYRNTSMGLVLTSGVTYELVVRADVKSTANDGDYTVSIADAAGNGTTTGDLILREIENDTRVVDITPNSVTLNKVEVEGSSITFSKNPISAAYTAVIGTSDVELFNFNVKAGEATDVILRELVFVDKNRTTTKSVVSEFKLWKGSTLLKTVSANDLTADYRISFTDLNQTIKLKETANYKLTVSLVNDTKNNGKVMNFGLYSYAIEETSKYTSVYDTAIDKGPADGEVDVPFDSARSVTVAGYGSINIAVDNTVNLTKGDSYQLAGTTGVPVATFKMKANNEDVKITSLGVVTSASLVNSISRMCLVDGTTEVSCTTQIGATTTTLDTDFVVSGEKVYTLTVDLTKIGLNEPGALEKTATFRIASVEAEGNASSYALSAGNADSTIAAGEIAYEGDTDALTAVSKNLFIVASKVASVDLKNSASGVSLSKLYSGQTSNAAILEITVPNTVNTNADGTALKLQLATSTFALTKSATVSDYTATIERIGGSNSAISASATGTTPTFVLNPSTNTDYQLNPGETVYLLVKVTPTFTSTHAGDTSLTLNFNSTNGLVWKDMAGAADKTGLRLPTTLYSGITVSN